MRLRMTLVAGRFACDLRPRLVLTWEGFFGRHPDLREIQRAAIPSVLDGRDVLLAAPTAGGKTEAAMAPLCERMLREAWTGLGIVVVAPTRPLVNDLFLRLGTPLADLELILGRKTSDHPQIYRGTRILITTPESLDSLLQGRKDLLQDVRAIVLDEIHLLDGTPRGDQLRLVVGRLRQLVRGDSKRHLQTLAMSATLDDPDGTAARYLGTEAEVVVAQGLPRGIDSRIVLAGEAPALRAGLAMAAVGESPGAKKVLVFISSRRGVDESGAEFRVGPFAAAELYWHHGSLSRLSREQTEARFRDSRCAVCVSTSTLEVGIDIGDIDVVVLMRPPCTLAEFQQRVGRGGRRSDEPRKAVCVATSRGEQLVIEAMLASAGRPTVIGPRLPIRRSVILQQILGYLRQSTSRRRTRAQIIRALKCDAEPVVSEGLLDELLADMCETQLLRRDNQVYCVGPAGASLIESPTIVGNIAYDHVERVVDIDSGRAIADVAGIPGENITLAGMQLTAIQEEGSTILVRVEGEGGRAPYYPPTLRRTYGYDVCMALAHLLQVPDNRVLAVQDDEKVTLLTWLGRLHNELLAAAARSQGVEAEGGSFGLHLHGVGQQDLLWRLRGLVERAGEPKVMDDVPHDVYPDLGRHLHRLSEEQQRRSRRDCFDMAFLRRSVGDIANIELIDPGDPRCASVEALLEL